MRDETLALQAIHAMTDAFHKQNINQIMASYEENPVIMFEPGTKVDNNEGVIAMFQGAFEINPKYSYPNGHEVIIAGDLALHIAPWKMQGVTPDGQSLEETGLSVAVLRKQEDGRWLLVLDNPHGQRLMA